MPVRTGKGGPRPKPPEQLKGARSKAELDRARPDRFVNAVEPPELDMDAAPVAREWFEALKVSPQAVYLTAADWQRARVCALMLSRLVEQESPSAPLYARVCADMDALLCSEDKRRQLRIEVRPEGSESGEDEAPEDVAVVRALRGSVA